MKTVASKEFTDIILVDDDADDRDLFAEALSFVNPLAKVEMKRDGEELMDHLNETLKLPDVIFLDLNMPRKSGKECLTELRSNKRFNETPVVIYTTSLNPVDIQETFNQGATFFLRKPNSYEELKETLHTVLTSTLTIPIKRSRESFVVNRTLNLV